MSTVAKADAKPGVEPDAKSPAKSDAQPIAKTPRERYRTQVRAEIKEHAREQIATAGASALSLNAIAKRMGMSGPALYRYFASRDELITELIRDAYRSLADTLRAASVGESELAALARALREWALADPQRYFLIYGTPVPGYRAPEDITGISDEIMTTLLDACTALEPDDAESDDAEPDDTESGGSAPDFSAHLQEHRDWAGGHSVPPAALHRALSFWTRLHGVLSLELAGHFTGMGFDAEQLFAAELNSLLA